MRSNLFNQALEQVPSSNRGQLINQVTCHTCQVPWPAWLWPILPASLSQTFPSPSPLPPASPTHTNLDSSAQKHPRLLTLFPGGAGEGGLRNAL